MIARPYVFQLWRWEVNALLDKASSPLRERARATPCSESSVLRYFNLSAEKHRIISVLGENEATRHRLASIRNEQDELRGCVEKYLENQVYRVLLANGIGNPFGSLAWPKVFPPVLFKLEEPPKLLIISPRDRILLWHRVTLRQHLTLEEREQIETLCDRLGVSSLVEDTGGMATYPSMVSENGGIRHVIETVIEEWVHQYLPFKPLGFLYLMAIWGIRRDPEIVTINETLAGMVSTELTNIIYREHYEKHEPPRPPRPTFDFNREMRVTRMKVDELLASGQVATAESYMEERRQFFIKNGYYIRKLNQAYFAFYGNYGQNPASVSPVYADLQALRLKTTSLADFLERAASVTSYSELRALI
ncbi:MAG: hypothetical protein N3E40_02755 [Dehalococcoidia bacterium]|nr:hypothetical protein [Dehalococcoidia bacterium]